MVEDKETPGTCSHTKSNLSLILTSETIGGMIFLKQNRAHLNIFRKQFHDLIYINRFSFLQINMFSILKDQNNSIY